MIKKYIVVGTTKELQGIAKGPIHQFETNIGPVTIGLFDSKDLKGKKHTLAQEGWEKKLKVEDIAL